MLKSSRDSSALQHMRNYCLEILRKAFESGVKTWYDDCEAGSDLNRGLRKEITTRQSRDGALSVGGWEVAAERKQTFAAVPCPHPLLQ